MSAPLGVLDDSGARRRWVETGGDGAVLPEELDGGGDAALPGRSGVLRLDVLPGGGRAGS